MALYDLIDDSCILALFCSIYLIVVVYTDNGLVCGNSDNIKLVDLLELVFLGHGSTCHTGELCVETEEVLEGDGSEGL